MTTTIKHPARTVHPATACLPYERQSASAARRLVRDKLREWGMDGLVDDAELIVSELVGNACKTGCMRYMTIAVRMVTDTRVRISVRDSSRSWPVLIDAGPDAEGGRGLALVHKLSHRWGAYEAPFGKVVWSEIGT